MPDLPAPSFVLLYGFWALLIATLIAAGALVKRYSDASLAKPAIIVGIYCAIGGGLAVSGLAADFDSRPPPFIIYAVVGFVTFSLAARSEWGRTLSRTTPIAILIGFQAFRFPLELLLHQAYADGLMPIQMSYAGRNFDILSGILGLAIGVWGWRRELPRAVVWGYNIIGVGLLINVVGIAIASTPVIALWGPDADNTWVTQIPFVWLPAVFVMFAWFTHLLLFRRLLAGQNTSAVAPPA